MLRVGTTTGKPSNLKYCRLPLHRSANPAARREHRPLPRRRRAARFRAAGFALVQRQSAIFQITGLAGFAAHQPHAVRHRDLDVSGFPGDGVVRGVCRDFRRALAGGCVFPANSALLLYLLFIFMYFSPKFLGVRCARAFSLALRRRAAACRGYARRDDLQLLLVPITWFNQTMFMTALLFGKGAGWGSQRRDGYRVSWLAAARSLWPATLFGA